MIFSSISSLCRRRFFSRLAQPKSGAAAGFTAATKVSASTTASIIPNVDSGNTASSYSYSYLSSSSPSSLIPTTATMMMAFSTSAQPPAKINDENSNKNKNDDEINQQFVSVLTLNMLRDNPGAVKKKRRVGRGIGSSKGKTCGRGHKGQKARSGGSIPLRFEGGQTPFFKLLPKRGFKNKRHKADMLSLNVGTIQDYIDMGRFPNVGPTNPNNDDDDDNTAANKNNDSDDTTTKLPVWTMKDLFDAGLLTASSVKHGVKLLAKGKERLRTPFRLEISRASHEAICAVEAVGGEVTTVHYNKLALRVLLKPHKYYEDPDKLVPKFARPPPKWQPYYTDWETNRGYLSVQAQMRKLLEDRPEFKGKFNDVLNKNNKTNLEDDTE